MEMGVILSLPNRATLIKLGRFSQLKNNIISIKKLLSFFKSIGSLCVIKIANLQN